MLISILSGMFITFLLVGFPAILVYKELDLLAFLWVILTWGGVIGYSAYDEQQAHKATSITVEVSE